MRRRSRAARRGCAAWSAPVVRSDLAALAALAAEESDFAAFARPLGAPAAPRGVHRAPDLPARARAGRRGRCRGERAGRAAIDAACAVPAQRAAITLDYEHAQAMAAIARAQDARDRIVTRSCSNARGRWPDRWLDARARCRSASPPGSATTWTGAPTSAGAPSSAFRLAEKAERLARYADALEAIDPRPRLARRPCATLPPMRRRAPRTSPATCPTRTRSPPPPTG